MNMRSYWVAFLLALAVHLLFFCSLRPVIKRPENGIIKGFSSLEVLLIEAPEEQNYVGTKDISSNQNKRAPESLTSFLKNESSVHPEPRSLNSKQIDEASELPNQLPKSAPQGRGSQKRVSSNQHVTSGLKKKKDSPCQDESRGSSGTSDATASYLHNPQPLYPEKERQLQHEGVVLLHIVINEQGAIVHLEIEHSSGYPALDYEAVHTVQNSWVFRPAYHNGKAISSIVLIPIRFSLKN